jgi:hypothetical protein
MQHGITPAGARTFCNCSPLSAVSRNPVRERSRAADVAETLTPVPAGRHTVASFPPKGLENNALVRRGGAYRALRVGSQCLRHGPKLVECGIVEFRNEGRDRPALRNLRELDCRV